MILFILGAMFGAFVATVVISLLKAGKRDYYR